MKADSTHPPGFVHVDLDGLWTLAGCYGYPEADSFERDLVFERGLARLLELFDQLDIRATFFIVGRDLEHPVKLGAIRALAEGGHELANHSWSHHFGLENLEPPELLAEIGRTSEAIHAATGQQPLGFRAPGYAAGPHVLTACSQVGLRYDGSRLPTRVAPALRWMAGRLRTQVRTQINAQLTAQGLPTAPPPPRSELSGQYAGNGPLGPEWFHPEPGLPPVLQLPLAVSPRLHLPLHASMGLMLGTRYVELGLRRLAHLGHPVSYLLHGMDALGLEDLQGHLPEALLRARPFQTPLKTKLDFLQQVLTGLKHQTHVQLTRDWFHRTQHGAAER